jgi:OOP family OmpA-OmpF porin
MLGDSVSLPVALMIAGSGALLSVSAGAAIERDLVAPPRRTIMVVAEPAPPPAAPLFAFREPAPPAPPPVATPRAPEAASACPPVVRLGFARGAAQPLEVPAELAALAAHVARTPGAQLLIRGHADGRGSDLRNLALSRQRAARVAQLLVQAGVPRSRMTLQGLGAYAPLGADDAAGENRRVSVSVEGCGGEP